MTLAPGETPVEASKCRWPVHYPHMAFTLRQLQYFLAVAEEGTVSGAAQSLSISQSAVTEAIK
jgi:hypothetical protein